MGSPPSLPPYIIYNTEHPFVTLRTGQSKTASPNSVRLQCGELAGIGAVLCREQDLSHLLDYRRFKRLDLCGNLRVEDPLAPIAAADITRVPQDPIACSLCDRFVVKRVRHKVSGAVQRQVGPGQLEDALDVLPGL